MAEHYGRIVSYEQGKIDNTRTPAVVDEMVADNDDEDTFPDFINNL
jgi:hypothetical protein